MTRRTFLSLMTGMLLTPVCAMASREAFAKGDTSNDAGSDATDAGKPPLRILLATDLHYLARELTDNGAFFTRMVESADGKVMLYSEELVDAFCAQVIERCPDVLILSGDLTFNGERVSHERLASKLAHVAAAGVRVLVIPGNHDLNKRSAARFEGEGYALVPSVTADEFRAIYGAYGYGAALSSDAHSLSYTAELTPGLRALFVDVNGVASPNTVPQGTLDWIDEQLSAAKDAGAQVITVGHQNLLRHNEMMYQGFTIDNAGELLRRFEAAGVLVNLSGHIHMQHIARSETGLCDIATSSLAVSPNQFGMLHVFEDRLEYATEPVQVSAWAREQGLVDPNLTDFAAYSASFFRETATRQALASVKDDPEAEQLAGFMARVNAAYFAGRTDLIEWDDALMARWAKQSAFFSRYLVSLKNDCRNDTRLIVDR